MLLLLEVFCSMTNIIKQPPFLPILGFGRLQIQNLTKTYDIAVRLIRERCKDLYLDFTQMSIVKKEEVLVMIINLVKESALINLDFNRRLIYHG